MSGNRCRTGWWAPSGARDRDGSTTTVKTHTGDGDRRLLQIAEAARMAVGGEHFGLGPAPDLVVLEDIPQNSFAAKPISMVHGVVRAVLIEAGAPYALVTAATLKAYATGTRRPRRECVPVAESTGCGTLPSARSAWSPSRSSGSNWKR
ncbi:hypothetical protein [Streptomyces sp. NPDC001999]